MRKRNHTVTIRMNKEEYDLFQSKVKESGRTQQKVVIKAIADLKIASTEEVEELKRLNQMFADILSQLRGATTNINQISKEGLENEFDRNRQKARDSAKEFEDLVAKRVQMLRKANFLGVFGEKTVSLHQAETIKTRLEQQMDNLDVTEIHYDKKYQIYRDDWRLNMIE